MNTLSIILLCLVIILVGVILYFNKQLQKRTKEIEDSNKKLEECRKNYQNEINKLLKSLSEKDKVIKDLEKSLEEKEQLIINIINNNPESIDINKK